MRLRGVRVWLLALAIFASVTAVQTQNPGKLDPILLQRVSLLTGQSRIVVTAGSSTSLDTVELVVRQAGGTVGRRLTLINGVAAVVPNAALALVANNSAVQHVAADRVVAATMERTAATIGAAVVRQDLGLDGSGIGVAIIDSGMASWHDDLAEAGPSSAMRVDRFVDFVGAQPAAYDDYGHGSHIAGIIAGNGFDSSGARSGIAPAARLTVLKVLDGSGKGRISDVIAALDYVVAHRAELNIRLVNVSIGAGVYESCMLDPLTLAAKRAVDEGIVVVAAAGNLGRKANGTAQYGAITAPGNAPWVVTVGASSHMGTIDRADDTVAAFSSRGPTAIDRSPKPDLVAPGVGIESLSAPNSGLYNTLSPYLLSGTVENPPLPYLSLSGTSMSAPVVTGVIALMLQANPSLTPSVVKAILQYTAQPYPGYDVLTQGAGFLNAQGAVRLASHFASPPVGPYPASAGWGRRLVWGTGRARNVVFPLPRKEVSLCVLACAPDVDAWRNWGTRCLREACNPLNEVPAVNPIYWMTPMGSTLVWATDDGGETVVWGTGDGGETVVWGTGDGGETVVWGTDDGGETVVWGTGDDGETVVWGTGCGSDPSCQPMVWPRQ